MDSNINNDEILGIFFLKKKNLFFLSLLFCLPIAGITIPGYLLFSVISAFLPINGIFLYHWRSVEFSYTSIAVSSYFLGMGICSRGLAALYWNLLLS
jgi:hypothetical protein